MNKYRICLGESCHVDIEADTFDVDEDNNLDMIVYDEEGIAEVKACFRQWVYVMEI